MINYRNASYGINAKLLSEKMHALQFLDSTLALATGVSMRVIQAMRHTENASPLLFDIAAIATELGIPIADLVIVDRIGAKNAAEATGEAFADHPRLGLTRLARRRLTVDQRKRVGLCIDCGQGPLKTKVRCEACATKAAMRARIARINKKNGGQGESI